MRTDNPCDYRYADCEKTQAPPCDEGFLRDVRAKQAAQALYENQCAEPTRPRSSAEILAELFSYHPPTVETLPKFAAINQAAKNFAEIVLQNCPAGSDRSGAINSIRIARMVANAAISLNGLSL